MNNASEEEARSEITHVCVAVRCRPIAGLEVMKSNCHDAQVVVQFPATSQLVLQHQQGDVSYTFDHVFMMFASQQHVFETLGVPQLDKAFEGYNSTIFSYGETGSGKTHTMLNHLGEADNYGLIPRICDGLFARIGQLSEKHETKRFLVQCSFLEIYNEVIYDLLAPPAKQTRRGGLEVKEQKGIGTYVKDLTETVVEDPKRSNQLVDEGFQNRTTRATKMNGASSRSHCVFTITLHQKDSCDSTQSTVSKINLVDLAGSERVRSGDTDGQRVTEGVNINKSLSALGNVINALSSIARDGKKILVPYRDSKLTRILQESFGGNSLCTMIATISPCAASVEETLSTLNFAKRAKAIKIVATKNEESLQVKRLEREVELLRRQEATSQEMSIKERQELDDNRKEQIETLEAHMRQSWEDKQKLSQQYDEEKTRAAEEAQRAAEQIRNEQQRRLQLLTEHADLQFSLQAVKALDKVHGVAWIGHVGAVVKIGQQILPQLRAARLYRESVATDLSALWGCCENNVAAAVVLLGQARAKLEALSQELDTLESIELQLWHHYAWVSPELAVALCETQLGSNSAGDSEAGIDTEMSAMLTIIQDQLSKHCLRELTRLRKEVADLVFDDDLERFAKCLEDGPETSEANSQVAQNLRTALHSVTALQDPAHSEEEQLQYMPRIFGISTLDVVDDRLRASSNAVSARDARLLRTSLYGGWCPVRDSCDEYLEIDVGTEDEWAVAGLCLQGRVPCTGKWIQTRDLMEHVLGTDEDCLRNAQPKTFIRPPVRFVHEASLALLRHAESSGKSRISWHVPSELMNFADLNREQKAEFFDELIKHTNDAWKGAGTEADGVALQLTPQDIMAGKNCNETHRLLQLLSYSALVSKDLQSSDGGLADVAPQWTSSWKLEYFKEQSGWQWFGSPEGGDITQATTFSGNSDAESVIFASLPEPLVASKLRLHPVDWHRHAAFRCEIQQVPMCTDGIGKAHMTGTMFHRASEPLKANVELVTRSISELHKTLSQRQERNDLVKAKTEEREQQERSDLEQRLANALAKIEYLESRAVTAETSLLRERAENERLSLKIEQARAETPAKFGSTTLFATSHSGTRQMSQDMQEHIDDLSQQLLVLTDERDVARGHAQELFNALGAKDEELAIANKARMDLMAKLEQKILQSADGDKSIQEISRLSGRLQGLQETHDIALQRSETLQNEVMRLTMENQQLVRDKELLAKKNDKMLARKDTYKERLDKSEQKRSSIQEEAAQVRDKCAKVLEKVQRSGSVTPKKTSESPNGKGDTMKPSGMARPSQSLTLGRCPGIPVRKWMVHEAYGQHLGLEEGPLDGLIKDALRDAFYLELPIPWEVHLTGDHLYFAHAGFEPAVTSWEHPLRELHVGIVMALRRAAGQTSLTPSDAATNLKDLVQHLISRSGISKFGTWAPSNGWSQVYHDAYSDIGVVHYQERKTGQRRLDDPRLAVASQIGVSLTALRSVWDNVVGTEEAISAALTERFPFNEEELWAVAEQVGSSVLREPRRTSSSRNLIAPDER